MQRGGTRSIGTRWEEWRAKRQAKIKRMEQRSLAWRSGQNGAVPRIARTVSLVPPQAPVSPKAVAPAPAAQRTLTAELCGDPLPGRSALDQRGGRV